MAFNINEIKSQLKFGVARQNLFKVDIQNPANSSGDRKTSFMVEASQIPAATIGTIQVPYFGRQLKLAGDRTFAPWSVQVINDEDFLIRNAMEEWSNRINRLQANVRDINNYKSQAQVTQYGKDGTEIRVYEFVGIFPIDVAAIDLAWAQNDSYESFQVTFEYDYWRVISNRTGDAGGE